MCGGDAALLSDYFEHILFVVAAAYSQLFCGLFGEYLLFRDFSDAHIVGRVFFDYFQWLNRAWQFESCVTVCSCSS